MKTGTSRSIAAAIGVAMTLTSLNLGTAQAATSGPTTTDISAHSRHYRHGGGAALLAFGAVAGAIAANGYYDGGYYGGPYYGAPYYGRYYGRPYGYPYRYRYWRHHRHG